MELKRHLYAGDIIENLWASKDNPLRLGVIKSIDSKHANMILPYKGKIHNFKYYRNEIVNDDEHFIVIGHIDLVGVLEEQINKNIKQ